MTNNINYLTREEAIQKLIDIDLMSDDTDFLYEILEFGFIGYANKTNAELQQLLADIYSSEDDDIYLVTGKDKEDDRI